jgi:hypothetical protein
VIIAQSLGPWAPWTKVIATLNLYLNKWTQAGAMVLPLDVTALRDSDGQQLFDFLLTQAGIPQGTPLPPVFPLTVTVIDANGKKEHLRFPS